MITDQNGFHSQKEHMFSAATNASDSAKTKHECQGNEPHY